MNVTEIKGIALALAVFATAATSVTAVAGQASGLVIDESGLPTMTVSFERSELSTSEGRAALEVKVRRAATLVCGSTDHNVAGTLHAVARNKACYERAVGEAMSHIQSDSLASID